MNGFGVRKKGILGYLAAFFIFVSPGPSSAQAKDERHGAVLVIERKQGQPIRGELLAVKENRLIILDFSSSSSGELDINEVLRLRVIKRRGLWGNAGIGSLLGGVAGLSADGLSWNAGRAAIAGASLGAVIGFLRKADDIIELAGKPARDVQIVLGKMKSLSRYPEPRSADTSPTGPRKGFPRFHFCVDWGYFGEPATPQLIEAFEKWGLGDDEIGIDPGWEWFEAPHDPCNWSKAYPRGGGGGASALKNLKIDFSLTRNWAVGFIYAPLVRYLIGGYQCLSTTINPRYGLKETQGLYLSSRTWGDTYFITLSRMSIPDGNTQKTGYAVGTGIGRSRVRNWIEGASNVSQEVVSPCLIGFTEVHHWFGGFMTLGIYADYKSVPVKFKPVTAYGWYDGRKTPVELSELEVNYGGLGIGLQFGLHL